MSDIRNGYRQSSDGGGDSLKDPMVEREFEAAEVLASMLNSSALAAEKEELNEDEDEWTRECGDCVGHVDESNGTWGSKGKRSNKRVRSESPPVDPVEAAENNKSVVLPLHFDADQAEAMCEQEIAPPVEYRDAVMVDKNLEFPGPSPLCQSSHVTGGKGRKNLSEAEKEARKLKRVLANRESARQTIRRRQALYEELRRKVADLMKDNENLKMEKHSALDEYTALKSSNKNLNDQVTKLLAAKSEHNHRGKGALASNSCYSPFPFPNFPRFMCQEGRPFFWPSLVNPSHNDEQEVPPLTFSGLEGRDGPWCIMQCPWLMPLPTARSSSPNLIQFLPTKDNQVEDNVSPTKTSTSVVDNHPSGIAVDLNTQCFSLCEPTTIDTNKSCDNVFGSFKGLHPENENNSFPLCDATENHGDAVLSNDVQFSVCETKKTETAATEARGRRKGLMRLKNLQTRSSRKAECW